MTASTITTKDDGVDAQAELFTVKPSRLKVIQAIRRDVDCTYDEAFDLILWTQARMIHARRARATHGHPYIFPNGTDLRSRNYQLLDQLIPHDAKPAPGSAHELLSRYVLDAQLGEDYITHFQHEGHCTLGIGIGFDC